MENPRVTQIVQQLMGVPQFRRLKLMIQGCEHDADREIMVKQIRAVLTAGLTEFRKKPL